MSAPAAPVCGGVGGAKPATDDIHQIVKDLEPEIRAKHPKGADLKHIKAVSYASQVVAGTNYFIKIDCGDGEHMHVRVHKPLPCHSEKPTLHSVQLDKKADDPIGHF